jgi:molybdopterin-guanine dinucleotide biosynthesis protein B
MKVFGLAGWSGSGKTTLVRALLPELIRRGLTVSTIKHAHHAFDVDQPGKDSYEHRQAGASEVMVASDTRWALMHELRGAPEPSLDMLLDRLSPVDLVLIEGFKRQHHAKLEVFRPDVGKPMLCGEDPSIVAVASDRGDLMLPRDLPLLPLREVAAIADFVIIQCGLAPPRTPAPAALG